jgi:antitoxin component of RelBE/YafQ-DinJ toxin-antitoxin module
MRAVSPPSPTTGAAAVPRPQLNARLDPRSEQLLYLLQERLNLSPSAVVRAALAALAREQGIAVPPLEREQERE